LRWEEELEGAILASAVGGDVELEYAGHVARRDDAVVGDAKGFVWVCPGDRDDEVRELEVTDWQVAWAAGSGVEVALGERAGAEEFEGCGGCSGQQGG